MPGTEWERTTQSYFLSFSLSPPLLFPSWLPPPSSSVWHRSLALAFVVSQLNYNGIAIFFRACLFMSVRSSGRFSAPALCFSKTSEFLIRRYVKYHTINGHKSFPVQDWLDSHTHTHTHTHTHCLACNKSHVIFFDSNMNLFLFNLMYSIMPL